MSRLHARPARPPQRVPGFTLLELLIVLVEIISVNYGNLSANERNFSANRCRGKKNQMRLILYFLISSDEKI